jgi:Spy/CpxP family protein refolding chaperone
MKNRTIISATVAMLVLLIAAPAFSRPGGPGGRGDGRRFDKIVETLGLDAQQAARLKTMHETHRDAVKSIREQVKARREGMKSLWLAPNPDRSKITAAQREIQALHGQIGEERIDFLFGVRSVLRPDQFQKFIELAPGRHGKGPRHGARHGGGAEPCVGEECDEE